MKCINYNPPQTLSLWVYFLKYCLSLVHLACSNKWSILCILNVWHATHFKITEEDLINNAALMHCSVTEVSLAPFCNNSNHGNHSLCRYLLFSKWFALCRNRCGGEVCKCQSYSIRPEKSQLQHCYQKWSSHTCHVGQTKMREVFAWQRTGVRVEM